MVGAIVKWDVLLHPVVTVRCFGWRVFFKAVLARRNTTFLSLLTDSQALRPAGEGVPEFVARCVELELKVNRIYESLARRFSDKPPVQQFFSTLARQELDHAELLELASTAASLERWDESKAAPWRDAVPRLEQQMQRAISYMDDIDSVRSALEHVIHIESTEINDVFNAVISASDSKFVRHLRAFHSAERVHLHFICRTIERLQPDLTPASKVLAQRIAA